MSEDAKEQGAGGANLTPEGAGEARPSGPAGGSGEAAGPGARGGAAEARSVPAMPPPVELDAELEAEIQAALGAVSLGTLYEVEEMAEKEAEAGTRKGVSPPPGVVRAKVVGISGDDIFIDLGGKSQGLLHRQELGEEAVAVGQEICVAVVGYDQQDGLVLLSKKTADQQLLRRDLRPGALVEGRAVGANKGGLEMDIKGLRAFMPASQIGFDRVEDLNTLVGQRFTCVVIEVERGDRNIVLSRRRVLEKEQQEARVKLWAEIEVGQVRQGVVRRLAEYGAFVDLGGGVDGLLHVSEMSWARVQDAKEIVQEGQVIEVRVVGVDREKERIALSLKQASANPWTTAEQKYPAGSRHQARITHLHEFGAFAELEPGVEGLIPISEMAWTGRVRHPKEVVQPGQMVEATVLRLDAAGQKMSLSIRSLQDNPWSHAAERYRVNEAYQGRVVRLTDFGAFVMLEEGIDGLVHVSEMSDKRVGRPGDVVKVGEEVQVRVLGVDAGNQRISLSLKGLGKGPAAAAPAAATEKDRKADHKKKERPRRGGLTFVEGDDAARKLGLRL